MDNSIHSQLTQEQPSVTEPQSVETTQPQSSQKIQVSVTDTDRPPIESTSTQQETFEVPVLSVTDAPDNVVPSTEVSHTASKPQNRDDGGITLQLSHSTVEILQLKVDPTYPLGSFSDSTRVPKLYQSIPKSNVLADVTTRGLVSEFSSFKSELLETALDDLVFAYDGAADDIFQFKIFISPTSIEQFNSLIGEGYSTSGHRSSNQSSWISLGSDREIDSEKVSFNRDLIYLTISKMRRDFGGNFQFSDRDALDSAVDLRPYKDISYELTRMEQNVAVQAAPILNENYAQTNWNRLVNFSSQTKPDISKESINTAVKEAGPTFEEFVDNVQERLELMLQQNGLVDIFRDEYLALGEDADIGLEQGAQSFLQEYQSFTDLKHSKEKSIACVDWHPTQKGVLAVSCVQPVTFDERVDMGFNVRSKEALLLIWSFYDPIRPQLILEAPDDIYTFRFNSGNPNIIAGGCTNGQIVIWDISEYQDRLKYNRKGGNQPNTSKGNEAIATVRPIAGSAIEFSHRSAILDLQWLPANFEIANNGDITESKDIEVKNLITASIDGQIFFWRFKKEAKTLDQSWRPFLKIPLTSMDGSIDYGGVRTSFIFRYISKVKSASKDRKTEEPEDEASKSDAKQVANVFDKSSATKLYCATEEGDVVLLDWMAERTEDKASRIEMVWNNHPGMVADLQRSPHHSDILLSVGCWTFHLWKEGLMTGPLMSSSNYPMGLTSGRWSPTRPGVFYIAKADGSIEAWDLLDRSHVPSLIQNVSSSGITYMCVHQYQGKDGVPSSHHQFIAAGDDNGTLHILQIPRTLCKPMKNEKNLVKTFYEREVRRINYAQERKILRSRDVAKSESNGGSSTEPQKISSAKPDDSQVQDKADEALEKQYRTLEREFLDKLEIPTGSHESE